MASAPEKNRGSRDVEDRLGSTQLAMANDEDLDEYGKLSRYISTYRESVVKPGEDEGEIIEKRVWYAPWKKRRFRVRKVEGTGYPDEWLMTNIQHGLTSHEAETRRRRAGYNELSAEKENLLAKFITYFQGPILYGTRRCNLPVPVLR